MIDDCQQRVALGMVVAFAVLSDIVIVRMWSRWLSRSSVTSGMESIGTRLALLEVLARFLLNGYQISKSTMSAFTFETPLKTVIPDLGWRSVYITPPRLTTKQWNFANQNLYNPALAAVKNINLVIPAPTRVTLARGQIPHLKLHRHHNLPSYHRPYCRRLPTPANTVRLLPEHPGRQMNQSRRYSTSQPPR
ncbi:hypothetical protein N7447_008571 [Penicillium robsamsonii]|uniref:uncharacterized protein n=1 Tax=Penicillium robsamsonii TaxID=1792511 RepID=UPI0025487DC3|nr:uncharacterized protein N7447_008571 [Penicillium robsamsonii]KAJ5816338.1 hypothetical protein N7447_008571 [Penicillium robsamsonii]